MQTDRVVFDCNVFFQALITPRGPAGICFIAAENQLVDLYYSDVMIDELTEICLREHLAVKFDITAERLDAFLAQIRAAGQCVSDVPHSFDYPRDPDDEPYLDLAIAVSAKLLISRDKDLLSLKEAESDEAIDFRERFPTIEILTPTELLERLK